MRAEQLEIALVAAGWAAAVGVAGLAVGWWMRRRSLRWQLALVAVVAVCAVVAGVVGTARAMFLSEHDFRVVLGVCVAAGVVAVGVALAVGAVVVGFSHTLRDQARSFGLSGEYVDAQQGPAELTAVSAELRRTSDRLREAREDRQRLEDSRRELVSWVSHDLRTPLAGLRAMAEALEDGLAEDPGLYHRRIRTEVDRMVRMVDDLFELSRIHAGVPVPVRESLSLEDVVSEAVAAAEPLARAAGVHLGGAVDARLTVHVDPAGLSRVVANLLVNAIRHTPAGGAVTVRGGPAEGGGVELRVDDECGGIPEPDLGRVFEVAWRGSTARTPAEAGAPVTPLVTSPVPSPVGGTGAGLGLAIVQGIVEAHGGSVTAHNQGAGCRFVVHLPG